MELRDFAVVAVVLYLAIVVLRLDAVFFAVVVDQDKVLFLFLLALYVAVRKYWVGTGDECLSNAAYEESSFCMYAEKHAKEVRLCPSAAVRV